MDKNQKQRLIYLWVLYKFANLIDQTEMRIDGWMDRLYDNEESKTENKKGKTLGWMIVC